MDFTLKRLGPPHLYKQNKLVKPSEMFPRILMWFSYNKNKKGVSFNKSQPLRHTWACNWRNTHLQVCEIKSEPSK